MIKIDELLIEYFERNLTTIKEFLLEQYPDRRKVLEAGFRAHAAKEYELSVLAFLSQVDGMFKEKLSVDFFEKRNKIPARAECYRIYRSAPHCQDTILGIIRIAPFIRLQVSVHAVGGRCGVRALPAKHAAELCCNHVYSG